MREMDRYEKRRFYTKVAFLLLGAGVIAMIAGLWWWAIFGVRDEIGAAYGGTTALVIFTGASILAWHDL